MSQCFTKQCECSGGNERVEIGLLNYATKADLKGTTGVDTSYVAAKQT